MKNVEIKAKIPDTVKIREILNNLNADFRGTDFQTDTYFRIKNGRLKLREGNIENSLIYYIRENSSAPKKSDVLIYKYKPDSTLKTILCKSLEILNIVKKKREIYFIENVKFHIDEVEKYGFFFEIEVIDYEEKFPEQYLHTVCNKYLDVFGITHEQLISDSYSDFVS